MRAAAEDFEMARLLGVNADRVIAVTFAIAGLLAGVAGFFLVARSGSVSPEFGVSAVLIAFIATIVGGLGSLPGAVLAGFGPRRRDDRVPGAAPGGPRPVPRRVRVRDRPAHPRHAARRGSSPSARGWRASRDR